MNNQAHQPDLNTNEVYVNPANTQNKQPLQLNQQQYQTNHIPQQNDQPVQNQQQNQPRVQQSNEQLRGENQLYNTQNGQQGQNVPEVKVN